MEENMSKKMTMDLFDEFTGSVKREIDEKSERMSALDEKNFEKKPEEKRTVSENNA